MYMTELLRNAWMGWQDYTEDGKLVALLLAVLLFLWLTGKGKKQGTLVLYSSLAVFCCILPVPAVFLMLYQTKFYDYEWIWSMVPLTAVIAYGIAVFWAEYCGEYKNGNWGKSVPLTMLLLLTMLLCANPDRMLSDSRETKVEKQQAQEVLQLLLAAVPESGVCLWAPREIMEYARETDAAFRLPYGRNMWDASLNAYAYDIYDEETGLLYQWMTQAEAAEGVNAETESGEKTITVEEAVVYALRAGVDCVLLPDEVAPEVIRRMEAALGVEAQPLKDYYLFACYE